MKSDNLPKGWAWMRFDEVIEKVPLTLLSTDMLGVIYDGFIHDLKWTIIIK
jgi:hypothetical protein